MLRTKMQTTPQAAREHAGLSLRDAAKRAQISERYLRQIERSGAAPYHLARRLAALYGGCSLHCFLPQRVVPAKPKGGK